MSLRPWDYHPDHRYTGVVVQDAINMVIVGNLLPYVPKLSYIPVMLYMWDHFQKPYPFIPDVLVDVDTVYEQKMDALHLYTSQMYEWLDHPETDDPVARRAWLKKKLESDMTRPVNLYRQKLIEIYGKEKGEQIRHAEAFEVCEYGAPLTPEARKRLFPFI
jgi:N-acetylglucosamine malate deacetylase 1